MFLKPYHIRSNTSYPEIHPYFKLLINRQTQVGVKITVSYKCMHDGQTLIILSIIVRKAIHIRIRFIGIQISKYRHLMHQSPPQTYTETT